VTRSPTHFDDVVGVEVTIDGMLVIADRLNLMDFPVALGIRLNIPQVELRNIVWEQVARDLTAQGVLDLFGEPHAEVAAMIDTLSRADRTLEGRWWRRDLGGKMVRFVVCRNGYQDLLGRSCVVINHVVPGKPNIDVTDLVQQFERHVPPGRVVVLPWDKHIAAGTEIQLELLSRTFRRRIVELAAALSDDFDRLERR
jgi:MinD-like ATPase involved in chromosome partitioning or flagellar assembly